MKTNLYILLFLLAGCTASKYSVIEPQPTLSVKAPEVCEQGAPFTIDIAAKQEGASGDFALSALILSGEASIRLSGSEVPAMGGWVSLPNSTEKLTVIPDAPGELKISLQVRSSESSVSEKQLITLNVLPTSEIAAEAVYDTELVNPDADTRLPIALEIGKPGYEGPYTVKASLAKGKGMFFYQGNAVNDMAFSVGASCVIEYNPEILGEHVFDLEISAGSTATTIHAYVDVIKDITVEGIVADCFRIAGTGRHNTDGKAVTLALENEPGYNFEVEGWYDGTTLLSADPTYSLTLSKGSLSALCIKLKKRTVTLSLNGVTTVEQQYLVQVNGKPVVRYVYDKRTGISSDQKVSEPIKFYYQAYQYNMGTIPPTARTFMAAPAFAKGTNWAGHFYRIDGSFSIYLRKEDNPGLSFVPSGRYIESASTRYKIPSNIIMQ